MSLSLWRACPAVWESKKWKEKQSDGNIWMSFVLQCQTMGVEWIFSRRWRCTYLCKYIKCRNMTSAMSAAGSFFFFSSVDLKQWLGLSPIEMSVNYMYRHDKLAVLWLHLFYYNVVYKVLPHIFLVWQIQGCVYIWIHRLTYRTNHRLWDRTLSQLSTPLLWCLLRMSGKQAVTHWCCETVRSEEGHGGRIQKYNHESHKQMSGLFLMIFNQMRRWWKSVLIVDGLK